MRQEVKAFLGGLQFPKPSGCKLTDVCFSFQTKQKVIMGNEIPLVSFQLPSHDLNFTSRVNHVFIIIMYLLKSVLLVSLLCFSTVHCTER